MFNNLRKNSNKGFSLVELIVVIAIMAILTAVLAPSLLQYVERSRAQKDDSAMGEVTDAVEIAIADQDVYDEVLRYTCRNNVSCYVDNSSGSLTGAALEAKKIYTNAAKTEFTFGDDCRKDDEAAWEYDGVMRGMTITFKSTGVANKNVIELANGVINEGAADGVAYLNNAAPDEAEMTLGAMNSEGDTAGGHCLYNRVTGIVGETIEITSQTYRNSDYTVFVSMGSTGGNAADGSSVEVYGQWSGTNLPIDVSESPINTPVVFGKRYIKEYVPGGYVTFVFYADGSYVLTEYMDYAPVNTYTCGAGCLVYTETQILSASTGEVFSDVSADGKTIGAWTLEE